MQLEHDVIEISPVRSMQTASSPTKMSTAERSPDVRRILVCVDHSIFSRSCIRHAIAISKSLGGEITLLHVMEPPQERARGQSMGALDWEIARQEASAFLRRLELDATEAAGQPLQTRLEQGHAAERITAVARDLDADVTILGSQGDRGAASWDLGSTVLQVLAVAKGSVLVVRPTASHTDAACPRRILVPLDGSLRAESVLPTVVRIASMHRAEVLLALVVHEPIVTGVLCSSEDLLVARDLAARLEVSGRNYLENLRGQLEREGTAARTVVLRSRDESQPLLELSRKERSDLVVLSAHGSNCNPDVICGSVTVSLLTHADVPLLVLQDLPDTDLRGQQTDNRAPKLKVSCPPVDA